MRVKITLACTECKQRNYDTMKNKKNTPDRIELNKYCPFCKKHTLDNAGNHNTGVVIACIVVVGAFIGVLDAVFTFGLQALLKLL